MYDVDYSVQRILCDILQHGGASAHLAFSFFGRKRGELKENSHKTKENKYIKLR